MKKTTENKKTVATKKRVVGNYEKHPFFVKKNNAATEFLLNVGLPENYTVKVSHTK